MHSSRNAHDISISVSCPPWDEKIGTSEEIVFMANGNTDVM